MSKSALLGNEIGFVQAAYHGGRQRPSSIILSTSWTTGVKGAANGIAQAWHNPNNRPNACHYVIDEAQLLRCIPDKVQAYYPLPGYKGAISIMVCHDPPFEPHPLIMSGVAELTARLCKLHHIPVRILNDKDEQRWLKYKWRSKGGIILKTVGAFPINNFLDSVEYRYRSF